MEDGLRSEVAEGDVVGSPKGVLMNIHHEVVVVVPMLVATCSIRTFDPQVHWCLQNVSVNVVEHGCDFDVLYGRVEVWTGPRMVGEGVASGFVSRP